MDIYISKLPADIKYYILEYVNYNYLFDKDSIYFNIHPMIHFADNKLCINIFSWFGCFDYIHKNLNILHTIYDRPYDIKVERIFNILIKKINIQIKKYKFEDRYFQDKDLFFSGTYGPMVKRWKELNFNKCSNFNWSIVISNKLNYFKSINFIENNKNKLEKKELDNLIKRLFLELKDTIKIIFNKYENINHRINFISDKEYNITSYCILYNLQKKISDNSYFDKKLFTKYL
tara:strand:- start:98 stop:793 length:696 start_codon:yes stop_codon:yes gene_type:complete